MVELERFHFFLVIVPVEGLMHAVVPELAIIRVVMKLIEHEAETGRFRNVYSARENNKRKPNEVQKILSAKSNSAVLRRFRYIFG